MGCSLVGSAALTLASSHPHSLGQAQPPWIHWCIFSAHHHPELMTGPQGQTAAGAFSEAGGGRDGCRVHPVAAGGKESGRMWTPGGLSPPPPLPETGPSPVYLGPLPPSGCPLIKSICNWLESRVIPRGEKALVGCRHPGNMGRPQNGDPLCRTLSPHSTPTGPGRPRSPASPTRLPLT